MAETKATSCGKEWQLEAKDGQALLSNAHGTLKGIFDDLDAVSVIVAKAQQQRAEIERRKWTRTVESVSQGDYDVVLWNDKTGVTVTPKANGSHRTAEMMARAVQAFISMTKENKDE